MISTNREEYVFKGKWEYIFIMLGYLILLGALIFGFRLISGDVEKGFNSVINETEEIINEKFVDVERRLGCIENKLFSYDDESFYPINSHSSNKHVTPISILPPHSLPRPRFFWFGDQYTDTDVEELNFLGLIVC